MLAGIEVCCCQLMYWVVAELDLVACLSKRYVCYNNMSTVIVKAKGHVRNLTSLICETHRLLLG